MVTITYISIKEDKYGWTPLHLVCQKGHIAVVKYLLEHGFDMTN